MQNAMTLSYPMLGISVFARQLCLPVPALLFLIAAGALARQGELSVPIVLAVSVAGCLGGDLIWFEAGRRWGGRILHLFTGFTEDPKRTSARARQVFDRWGLRSLLLAKFIPGLDGITPPLAGLEGASRRNFILYDGAGSLVWSGSYVILGLFFSKQVDGILAAISRSGTLFLFCVGIPLALYVIWRGLSILRMMRQLKMKRISPELLSARLAAGEVIVIIDLLNFQESPVSAIGIPGAVRIAPERLRNNARILSPDGLSVVLYCSTSDQFRSARTAMSLKKKGITDVWVLDGGLNGWIDAGFPVTNELLSEDDVIAKFGLKILSSGRGRRTEAP